MPAELMEPPAVLVVDEELLDELLEPELLLEPVELEVSWLSNELRLLPLVLLVVVIAIPCQFPEVIPPKRKLFVPPAKPSRAKALPEAPETPGGLPEATHPVVHPAQVDATRESRVLACVRYCNSLRTCCGLELAWASTEIPAC